jgi:hypothetical protein
MGGRADNSFNEHLHEETEENKMGLPQETRAIVCDFS